MENNIKKIIHTNIHFKDIDEKYINFLVKHANFTNYKSNDFIFNFRDKADNFYLIVKGKVSLQMFSHERGEIVLEEIKEGEILGWSWLKDPCTWRFDALSITDTTLISFNAKAIKDKMNKNSKFGYQIQNIFMSIIIERMQSTRLRLLKELGDNIYIPD